MSDVPNIEAAVARAAAYVQATWQQAVMGSIQVPGARPIGADINLRRLYSDSIVTSKQLTGAESISVRILTVKKIAEQLEKGCGPFDMKPALLGGPKAPMGKNGRYNIIPFRQGTAAPGSANTNFKPMPTDIYAKAKQLVASRLAGNAMKWGGRLTGTEKQYPAASNPTTGAPHKSGRFEGMVRVEKTYRAATQSKYLTFRVVSDKSDPGSWFHPGYQAHNIAKAVGEFCRPAVEKMIHSAALADLQSALVTIGAH